MMVTRSGGEGTGVNCELITHRGDLRLLNRLTRLKHHCLGSRQVELRACCCSGGGVAC